MLDYQNTPLEQIRLWAWAAAVLPITALACVWFIWVFGTATIYDYAMVAGFTIMFGIACALWWWAIYTIRNLVVHYSKTRQDVEQVVNSIIILTKELSEIKSGANRDTSNNNNKP